MHVQFIDLHNISYQTSSHISDLLVSMFADPKIALSSSCSIQSVNTLFVCPWPLQEKKFCFVFYLSFRYWKVWEGLFQTINDPLTKVWPNFLLTYKCFSHTSTATVHLKGKGALIEEVYFFKLTDIRKLLVCHPARNNVLYVWFGTIVDNLFYFRAKGIVLLDTLYINVFVIYSTWCDRFHAITFVKPTSWSTFDWWQIIVYSYRERDVIVQFTLSP